VAVDISALLKLQQRRTQRAQDKFAAADRARRAVLQEQSRLKALYGEVQRRQLREREEQLMKLLQQPATLVSIARVRLQYEVGSEELNKIGLALFELEAKLAQAEEDAAIAREHLQACTKREKKLDAAAAKLKVVALRIEDVQAEMELEK
jgi:hypothetical protein